MNDAFNMTMRKFLKQVGVTSQQAIEEAVRNAGGAAEGADYDVKVVLSIEALDLEHVVTGKISGDA